MGDADKRVVWILGAGFSRSLGGPLLAELLSPESERDVDLRFPRADAPELSSLAARLVRAVYVYGCRLPVPVERRPDLRAHESLWDHAEDFLDYLDTAARAKDGPRAKRILQLAAQLRQTGAFATVPLPGIEELGAVGRRLIAAECCAFLSDADTSSERWKPYRTWAASLGKNDTVITFNYDRVLEMLNSSYLVIEPPEKWNPAATNAAQVFKLHGSVDWCRDGEGVFSKSEDPSFALRCRDEEIAIATPGPSKLTAVGELKWHWREAMQRIKDAHAVVFVGFRFPPSDAEARTRVLDAIATNGQARQLELHAVLGPASPDAPRLEHLLRFTGVRGGRVHRPQATNPTQRTFSTAVHPLFAEDFFSVYDRRMLFDG